MTVSGTMMILAEQWHRDTVTAKLSQDSLRKLHFTAVNVSEKFSLFLFIGLLAYIVGWLILLAYIMRRSFPFYLA